MKIEPIAASAGLRVFAPAKLNLFLEVSGKRADGYHDLESLMITVDLHDTLEFENDPSGRITFSCDDPMLPTGSDNLVVKAAELLQAERGGSLGAKILLRKEIPSQAGLAGGSSDATATIEALDRLWGLGLPVHRKEALAASIGSDTAFFLHGPVAVCRGRGEIVEPRSVPTKYWFVLVSPSLGVSTADVFRRHVPPARPLDVSRCLEAFETGDAERLGALLFNRLQPIAESWSPELIRLREALSNLGPLLHGHLMSGSGSTYFGLARDAEAADEAAGRLATLGLGRVRVVSRGPEQ